MCHLAIRSLACLGLGLTVSSGCGRIGFDELAGAQDDAGPPAPGPPPSFAWSRLLTSPGEQVATAVAADAEGNVIVVGSTEADFDFGDGLRTSLGGDDIFIASLSSSGQLNWSRIIGSTTGDDSPFDVAVDQAGNVYVTGGVRGDVDFGQGPVSSFGDIDIFLASFDSGGALRWAHIFGDASGGELGFGLAVPSTGGVVMTGWFNGSVDFGNGLLVSDNQDVVVLTVSDQGQVLQSRSYSGMGIEQGQKIAVDASDQLYLTGVFTETSDIGSTSVPSGGGRDTFAFSTKQSGEVRWSYHAGGLGRDDGTSVAVTPDGRAFIGGSYDSVSLDTGSTTLVNQGRDDGFAVAYDVEGTPRWTRQFASAEGDTVQGLAYAADSTLLVAGRFRAAMTLDGITMTPNAGTDIYLAGLADNGAVLWARQYGSVANDSIRDMALAPDGAVYIVGNNATESDFGGGPLVPDGTDPFLFRLNRSEGP